MGSFFENIRKAEAEGSLILEIFRKPKLEGFVILNFKKKSGTTL